MRERKRGILSHGRQDVCLFLRNPDEKGLRPPDGGAALTAI